MKSSIATVSISGTLPEKLHAAAAAGFQGIEIFENDLIQFEGSATDIRDMAKDLNLEIVALQPFRDFEAMPEPFRSQNFYRARKKFELMHQLGTKKLLICSSVSPHLINDPNRASADLYELADIAKQEGFNIGYEALAWGRYTADYGDAWNIVKHADHPNLGIVLDSFHMFARGNTLDILRKEIPLDKIALVQVADAPALQMEVLHYSRHYRCFPGQGDLPVKEFVQCLRDKGYNDYLSHEIFNDEFRSSPAAEKAIDGIRSLIWLDEKTSKQATKEVDEGITDVEFIEFALPKNSDKNLLELLNAMGFSETHIHRSKNVTLMRQGNINLVMNREPSSQAHEHFETHGTSVCALAMKTNNLKRTFERAKHYHCQCFMNQAGPGELNIPAIKAIGDSLIYLLDDQSKVSFFDVDFKPLMDQPYTGIGLSNIDHIGQTVAHTDFLSAAFFYKSLLEFDITPNQDLADVNGLVVSRLAVSNNMKVRIPLNMTSTSSASSRRFLDKTKGSGVQQIAFSCEDIFSTAAAIGNKFLLPIPDNYYLDLDARFAIDPDQLILMQQSNIMYDRNSDGEFFHCYTRESNGVFFEILQRVGHYQQYGEPNAHIRLAAQSRLHQKTLLK
ncbi:sugar phosphate isomerase/epimerase and 4-hydroxyphenylpyruvate domain-containing protein [Amphritea sp.]|uniref:bifunctional sugar phosphate isomerase/epimerase/4-hydroxyphenylpyruvate dioxygenase family protein n=1 Tax=Amphritea sp. TaxID=1872502 RepID=UPI0025BEFBD8|nr:sugar phosphate isomerase/epimerase and 4-hydroxyphenylpyruvate domain-containing protein [Amphritea sp.]